MRHLYSNENSQYGRNWYKNYPIITLSGVKYLSWQIYTEIYWKTRGFVKDCLAIILRHFFLFLHKKFNCGHTLEFRITQQGDSNKYHNMFFFCVYVFVCVCVCGELVKIPRIIVKYSFLTLKAQCKFVAHILNFFHSEKIRQHFM